MGWPLCLSAALVQIITCGCIRNQEPARAEFRLSFTQVSGLREFTEWCRVAVCI